ncbi:hypothetical protein [Ornithinibacillus bavariensis]|uniref:Uncharacterized protein n=1 Tax=Ornithinibacillus bavariensis TaxID=545502 RepID=A0A920C7D8_9BACI|nr:hypothetical protein [Ornithinibacillus bavariensis]GIO27568.1 hypothetical protein J43TS3_21790 [Ornithinibacillus bavariensis]
MADERIATIVKEIKYWKEHKLLPEVQCDFLLALYTQGEEESTLLEKKSKGMLLLYLQIILLVMMVPFSFLVVYFTQYNFILQLSILLLSIGYAIWVYSHNYKKKSQLIHIALILLLVQLFIATVLIANLLKFNQYMIIAITILNFVGWFFLGQKLRNKYLIYTGILAMVITLFVNFSHLFSFNY